MAISLELAISAIRSGRREEGRQLLNLLIQQNPNNEMAWVWMSSVVDTDEQRARCLYHALAINPGSQLARRGLQVLGIVVSDSRPVKIPRDSQPITIPRPTVPAQSESPSPTNKAVTEELPFTPVRSPAEENIAASPSILQINVEDFITSELENTPAGSEAEVSAPDFFSQSGPGEGPGQPPMAGYTSSPEPTKTQQMPSPFLQGKGESPQGQETPPPGGIMDPGSPGQVPAEGMPPTETRPSQPMPVVYPTANPGTPYYPGLPSGQTLHSNMTMGMPQQPYGQFPSQPMYPGHSNVTMGMPLPPQGGYPAYPAGVMPGLHSNNTLGMDPYQQAQFQLPPGYHSNSTILMPPMSEAEARARASTSHAIPTANAMAMALQNPMPPAMDPGYQAQAYAPELERDEAEGEELNIVAVIIFGTLSITALGGLGMLILLLFTSPMSSG